MIHFVERHADKIMGIISCFDRGTYQGDTQLFNGSSNRLKQENRF